MERSRYSNFLPFSPKSKYLCISKYYSDLELVFLSGTRSLPQIQIAGDLPLSKVLYVTRMGNPHLVDFQCMETHRDQLLVLLFHQIKHQSYHFQLSSVDIEIA